MVYQAAIPPSIGVVIAFPVNQLAVADQPLKRFSLEGKALYKR